jgi:hypothetical protein
VGTPIKNPAIFGGVFNWGRMDLDSTPVRPNCSKQFGTPQGQSPRRRWTGIGQQADHQSPWIYTLFDFT